MELEDEAAKIQEREKSKVPDFNGFAWQGFDYDGLTCNALEWIASWGGLDASTNRILFDHPGVLKALGHAREWAKGENPISLHALENKEASLQMFLDGRAAFLRTWTSAYAKVKEEMANAKLKQAGIRFGVAPLPRGEVDENFGVVGAWQLAVSKRSLNQRSAIQLIRYLSSPEVQKWRASEGAYQPTIKNMDVQAKALPTVDIRKIRPIIRRSSQPGDRYSRVSECIYKSVREALRSNSSDVKQYIVNMKNCIERESKGIEREYEEPLKGEA